MGQVSKIQKLVQFCKAILGIFSLSYSILGIGMVNYHRDNKETPIYKVGEPESVSTADIASLLIFQNFDKKQVCSRTPIRPLRNLSFIVQKSKLSHLDDIFSDDLGYWVKSKVKSIKYEYLGDRVTSIVDRNDEKFENCYNIKGHIIYHHKSNNFHKVILTVENVDYIFLQYYFDQNELEVDINAPRGNAKRLKKPHRRT